ncbi:dirigent protein 16-like [Hibiscus syriacus]|uniref:dirigent protein 16-like n=1 Tax=Hibiscus syriacus TaxID=106335 RepID=UPI0019220C44|nr:dirigent protein 16-like [Hibiscus syriacus]
MSMQPTQSFITILIAAVYMVTCFATEEPVLEFYMHDILGGISPTGRPITGLLGNVYSGRVPFAKPVGFLPPPQDNRESSGVYVSSSADGTTQMMAFTAIIEGGEYNEYLNFYGVYKVGSTVSHVSVIVEPASLRMLVELLRFDRLYHQVNMSRMALRRC